MKSQTDDMKKFCLNLERWRLANNLTQAELAKRIGLSAAAYKKLINGDVATVTSETIKNIYYVTGRLCFHLMEKKDDSYLRVCHMIRQLPQRDLEFIEVMLGEYIRRKGME